MKFSDNETTIANLRLLTKNFVDERKWGEYHTPKSLAIALSIEAAELLENFLFKGDDFIPEKIENVTNEMADIFIYLMSLADSLNLKNFSEIINQKMEKNKIKYPVEKFAGKNYTKQ
jgi:dCTP diphosphatase